MASDVETRSSGPTLFVCPCCGYRTLYEAWQYADEVCEVCLWQTVSWRRTIDIAEGQSSFAQYGASTTEMVEHARKPRESEARPTWWLSIADARTVLVALIESAFEGVGLAGGVNFAEAELIDSSDLPSRTVTDLPPPGFGVGPRWQDVEWIELEKYSWGNFHFQDARGIRYYLPIFMCSTLQGREPSAMPSLLASLDNGHQLPELHQLLSGVQRYAVARFLAYYYADLTPYSRLRNWGSWLAYLDQTHQHDLKP
jgi:hypothetical protein